MAATRGTGLDAGRELPLWVNAYIEITPFDLIKYEVDKASGYLRVDRPQRTSSQPPSFYGFIPRTYCGKRIRAALPGAERGDGDPLDICVLCERPIHALRDHRPARVVGGLQLLDRGEADDKMIAVLEGRLRLGQRHRRRRAAADPGRAPAALLHDLQASYRVRPRRSPCRRSTAPSMPRAWYRPRSRTTTRCGGHKSVIAALGSLRGTKIRPVSLIAAALVPARACAAAYRQDRRLQHGVPGHRGGRRGLPEGEAPAR